jgi:hypothetical protein
MECELAGKTEVHHKTHMTSTEPKEFTKNTQYWNILPYKSSLSGKISTLYS